VAVPPAPSFYGDTIPAVVTPTDTIRFRAYCADALTLSAYFEPVQNDPMPIWYEETIEPDDVWGGVPVFYVEIPLAQTSVTAGKWRIGIRAHNNDGYSTHSYKNVRVAELPTVEIASPTEGGSIESMPLLITWNSSDATGISEQQLYVYDEDLSNLVLHRTLDGDARTSVIGIEDAAFENDSEYIVIVGAFNGVGLYNSDTVRFTTHWAPPATPTARTNINPADLSVSVTVFEGYTDGSEPATASLMVTRINPDGTRWAVASGLRSGETCIDPLPPLGVEYSYAVTAVTEAGTTSVANVTRTVESTAWALNFGATAGEVMTLVGNPKASYSLDQGGKAYHFADGGAGGGLPVWYGTTDRDESGTLSFDTMLWHDSDRLRELCRQYPVAWMRDPFGHRWRAHVQPKISHGIGDTWQVSINWDAVRFEEAW